MTNQTFSISGRQTIRTKFLGPTNTKPARINATSSAGISKTISYEYGLDRGNAHAKAAKALAQDLGWLEDDYIGGADYNGNGYTFVAVPGHKLKE